MPCSLVAGALLMTSDASKPHKALVNNNFALLVHVLAQQLSSVVCVADQSIETGGGMSPAVVRDPNYDLVCHIPVHRLVARLVLGNKICSIPLKLFVLDAKHRYEMRMWEATPITRGK